MIFFDLKFENMSSIEQLGIIKTNENQNKYAFDVHQKL